MGREKGSKGRGKERGRVGGEEKGREGGEGKGRLSR